MPFDNGQSQILTKASRFTVEIKNPDGSLKAVYNTSTGNYLVLDEEQRKTYEEMKEQGSVDISSDHSLCQTGFFIEKEIDELDAIRLAFGHSRKARYAPSLTIAPTMDCNFGCDYCFESHVPGNMTSAVQQQLVKFVTWLQNQHGGSKDLNITWFGGEPLMAMPVIRSLSKSFLTMREQGLLDKYDAEVVTNGNGLTPKVCQTLKECGVSHIQITIDGPPRIHDKRRYLKRDKSATFERIVKNIANVPEEISVLVRVNIDRANMEYIHELYAELEAHGVLSRVTVDLAQVEHFSSGKKPQHFLSAKEYAAFREKAVNLVRENGWPLHDPTPTPSLHGVCQVDSQNSFVVSTDGTLYKCWAELQNEGEPVGRLTEPTAWENQLLTTLTKRDPFDDDECTSCVLLPTCLGSCPKVRQLNKAIGEKECPPFKHNFADILLRNFGSENRIQKIF